MFVLHDFVMDTLRGMANVYPQWQVQQIALGYYAKGWIADTDLAEIASWYIKPEAVEPSAEPETNLDPYGVPKQ